MHREKLALKMHLKAKSHSCSVLLIYTMTLSALASAGWCEPTYSPHTHSRLPPHNVRNNILTMKVSNHPSNRPEPDPLQTRVRNQAPVSAGRPALRLRAKMASDARYHKLKQSERRRVSSSLKPSTEDCGDGKLKYTTQGTFYIVGQLQANIPKAGFQSDSAASVQAEVEQTKVSSSEQSWQKLQPVVECGDDAMSLIVRRRRAVNLQLDQMNGSSVSLSRLPPRCGYSVQTTWKDLSLMVQYDACHVTQEDDRYVLHLLWRGTPVKMSCPVPETRPPAVGLFSVCCSPSSMTVKLQGLSPAEELKINVRGEWEPLVVLAEQCGYTLERQGADAVVSAPYLTCGMIIKDEKYTFYLQVGEKTLTLSCPVSHLDELLVTRQPHVDSPHLLSREPKDSIPQSVEPFPWAAPVYLAPLYYPHPTYPKLQKSKSSAHGVDNPLPHSPSMPDPTFAARPLVDPQPDYPQYQHHQIPISALNKQYSLHPMPSSTSKKEDSSLAHPDQKQGIQVLGFPEKHSATVSSFSATGFPLQAEAPSVQLPRHAFNPYYHYYHHPKIPLSDPRQDPNPGPEVPEKLYSINPHIFEFPVFSHKIQPSDTNSEQIPESVPEAASDQYITTTSPEVAYKDPSPYAPHPPHFPHHYLYYFPHIAMGESKRLAPLYHNMAAEMNLSLSHSSVLPVHNKYNLYPHTDQPNLDKMMVNIEKYRSDQIENPPLSEDDGTKSKLSDKERQSPSSNPSHHNPSPYLFYYPYNHYYYQMYHTPERLHNPDNHESPSSFTEASDHLLQVSTSSMQHPSYHKHQTSNSPSQSTYDVGNGQQPLYVYEQEVSKGNQGHHPTGSMDSEEASSKSASWPPSDPNHSRMDLLLRAAEAGRPSILQQPHSPLYSLYSHYITQRHPYDPFGHPSAEEAEERLDNEMRVCTKGQHFVFVAPDSVLEPTLALHSSEDSEVPCTLQKLTSDPDVNIVPLEGCGVHAHLLDQAVVHLLEVQGIHSPQQDQSSGHEIPPIRLMVECSSAPCSPGEVEIHLMNQHPLPAIQPTPAMATLQLRLATDETFTHYHPEAHLPLSLIQGRLLYLEVSLLDPPEADLVLLVHSCLAYVQDPYSSWMPIYDGCMSWYDSQLLPSPDPHHIWRILISNFLFLPSESASSVFEGGYALPNDPQIYFLCLTDVCSAADGGCTVGCINSKFNILKTHRRN